MTEIHLKPLEKIENDVTVSKYSQMLAPSFYWTTKVGNALSLPRRFGENNTCFIMAVATFVRMWNEGVGNSSICRQKKILTCDNVVPFNTVSFANREQFTKKIQEQENLGKV